METEITFDPEAKKVVEPGREAIIFIPGIGRRWDDPSIEGVARRMAIAVDRQSVTEKAKVRVEVAEQEYGTGYKCKMFTIVKSDGQAARPLIDVFGLDYNHTLVESYARRNLLIKTILLAVTLLEGFRRMILRFYKRSKSLREKIQLAYGLLVAGLLIAYLVILIAAVYSSIEQLYQLRKTAGAGPQISAQALTIAPHPGQKALVDQALPKAQLNVVVFENFGDGVRKIWRAVSTVGERSWTFIKDKRKYFPPIIVLMTALGFVLPPNAKIKENISVAATNYLCLIHYLNWGERSHAIGGKLESLVEHLVESETEYGKIHIIGYSFGSIVAIDNMFPAGRKPLERFNKIETLVTIGCPFDMIRTYWPNYFKERQSLTQTPKWINVYAPMDILSSNFADGGNDQQIDESRHKSIGVELGVSQQVLKPENIVFSQGPDQGLGLVNILTLTGFKAHSMYWGEEVEGEITCFHDIVAKMYRGSPILN